MVQQTKPGGTSILLWGNHRKRRLQYTQAVRTPTASLTAQNHPTASGAYEITANYNLPLTSFTCRSLALYDNKTNIYLGGFYLANVSGSVTTDAFYPDCLGREVYAEGQAVTAAETVKSSVLPLPPFIASPPTPSTTCVWPRQPPKTCKTVPCVGDPINLGSGDVMAVIPLFTIDEPGEPLSLTLSYHSQPPIFRTLVGEMGLGWQHSFGQRLKSIDAAANNLYGVDAKGIERLFLRSSETLWVPARPSGGTDTVTLSGPGTEYLLKNDQETTTFDRTSGRWLSTTDRWGNTTSAQYDGSGNLASVTDACRVVRRRIADRRSPEHNLANRHDAESERHDLFLQHAGIRPSRPGLHRRNANDDTGSD